MAEKHEKINNLMENTFQTIQSLADVNTIIGNPIITASGCQIIPFSKVTVGNLAGGGEYGNVKMIKELDSVPFAGGNGAVVSMKPMGFLIDDGKGCHLLRITDEPLDNFIERAGELLRDVIAKD